MKALDLLMDAIIPGDAELSMPSASELSLTIRGQNIFEQVTAKRFLRTLDGICQERFSEDFENLNGAQMLTVINACKTQDFRLFTAFVTDLLKLYYTSPEVLTLIGVGSVPPFPHGNQLEDDDWSILEQVYERGTIYREAELKVGDF